MTHDVDKSFLQAEYFHLQETIEDFDQRALTIKAWSVTFSLAAVGSAFASEAPVLLLVAAAASLLFWIIEATWKSFQLAYYPRVRAIEAYMAGRERPASFSSPAITSEWAWSLALVRRTAGWAHVMLPHAPVVALGAGLWIADRYWRFIPG